MPDDSYHTNGARADRERTWKLQQEHNALLNRIAVALEKIAERYAPEPRPLMGHEASVQKGSGYDPE